MNSAEQLHSLTHEALKDLQQAFQQGDRIRMEGFILSAMVTVKRLHDQLPEIDNASADNDPEGYCCAV